MIKKIYQWLLPTSCALCNDKSIEDMDLCFGCYSDLPWLQQACIQCALPLSNYTNSVQHCGLCTKLVPPFDRTVALCSYDEPIISFINLLKFNGQLKYARLLSQLFIKYLLLNPLYLQSLPECIIPIPLHIDRLKERGFNQALELSRLISTHFKIPIMLDACQRIRPTQPQSLIHANQRRNNIKNAFTINKTLKAKHIAIIDDVVTTGTTVTELSQLFKEIGVARIDIWCYARTQVTNINEPLKLTSY